MVRFRPEAPFTPAGVAQLAEQLICNQQVAGSSPITSSKCGEIPEWLKGADCKSAAFRFVGSNPTLSTTFLISFHRGVEQLVARRAHNPKVVGSSPAPATILIIWLRC